MTREGGPGEGAGTTPNDTPRSAGPEDTRPSPSPDAAPAAATAATPAAAPRLIHEAVARQAALRPNAPAVTGSGHSLTYRELDARADSVASALTAYGAGPGTVVPVLLPRSTELVAVLLGILRSGAAYAALDPRWPVTRLARLVRALGAPVMVGHAAPAGADVRVWQPPGPPGQDGPVPAADVPAGRVPPVRVPPVRVPLPADGSSPASVFFTSGTTGEPKAVVSPHRATTRLFRAGTFGTFGPGRAMPLAAAVSWDAFSFELWSMLTTGGTVVVVEGDYLMPGRLRALIAGERVDTLWLTATLFNLFVDEDLDCFRGLTQVVTGGERLSVPHVRAFLGAHEDISLINGYGPVESCVFATTHRVRASDCRAASGIPVGRPVPATMVHVLDGDRPVPPGHTGEICVSGEGLALGYLGDGQATAASFVELRLDGAPTRLYRTGDLGALDADGLLHYHGRRDLQIKIAGHRVEPGEVEAHARDLPGVRDCAAVPAAGPDGTLSSVTLFCTADPRHDPPPDAGSVRRALASVLPRYMVPARVEIVEDLPRTPQGKPDRAALAER